MPCGDDDGADRVVVEHICNRVGDTREPEPRCDVGSRQARLARDRDERRTGGHERRKQGRARERTSADQPDTGFADNRPCRKTHRVRSVGERGRVLEQDPERPCAAVTREDVVCLCSVVDREAMSRQLGRRDPARCGQVEKRLHVPLFGPAHVARWKVPTALLVLAVVAPRAVGARHPELELLLVHRGAIDVDPRLADDHDSSAIPCELDGQLERIGGPRRGAQEHRVEPEPAGRLADGRVESGVRALESQRPAGARQLDRRGVEVDSDDPAAGSTEDPNRQLSHEPEPDDADALADGGACLTHAVHGDGADGGVRRVIEADPRWDGYHQVARHGDDLCVVGPATSSARHEVAGCETVDSGARPEHDACGGVADRLERGEPVPGGSQGHGDALRARLLDDLLDQVGAGASLVDEVLLAGEDLRPLGAGADQREAVRDEHPARPERRRRRLHHTDSAVSGTLCDLPHGRRNVIQGRPNTRSAQG